MSLSQTTHDPERVTVRYLRTMLLGAVACFALSMAGVGIIVNGIYGIMHPKPHPHEWEALGGAVLGALFGWPLTCVGICTAIGTLRGRFWRGLAWGVIIAVTPFVVVLFIRLIFGMFYR